MRLREKKEKHRNFPFREAIVGLPESRGFLTLRKGKESHIVQGKEENTVLIGRPSPGSGFKDGKAESSSGKVKKPGNARMGREQTQIWSIPRGVGVDVRLSFSRRVGQHGREAAA